MPDLDSLVSWDAIQLHYHTSWDAPWQVVTVFKDAEFEAKFKDDKVGLSGLAIRISRIDQPVEKKRAIAIGKEWLGVDWLV